ncbi:MAG: class I SAM-dependent methyltransferase [Nanoarchaeota archaeon]
MKDNMYENKSYSEHFQKLRGNLKILDKDSRKIKTNKILAVIKDYASKYNKNLKDLTCLDIGCSTGLITNFISKDFKNTFGIDTDFKAIELAKKLSNKNLKFIKASVLDMPFSDNSFDLVICNHIYEHVPDAQKMFNEIYRVLRKDGFCYLSAGNKYNLIEGHYKLPFLSWLPQSFANSYLRIAKMGDIYEEKHFSYFKIKRMLRNFKIDDYTLRIIKEPEKYFLRDMIKNKSFISYVPNFIFELFYPLIPTYIFIIRK